VKIIIEVMGGVVQDVNADGPLDYMIVDYDEAKAGGDKPGFHRHTGHARPSFAALLGRAVSGQSWANYPAIYAGFMAKGIPEEDIKPRENVFTFHAWRAKGWSVKKGEHGVKVITWVHGSKAQADGTSKGFSFPRSATVFHASQVRALGVVQ
jgi:hypothetical protein